MTGVRKSLLLVYFSCIRSYTTVVRDGREDAIE